MLLPMDLTLMKTFEGTDTFFGFWIEGDSDFGQMPWKNTPLDGLVGVSTLDTMLFANYGHFFVSPLTRIHVKAGGTLPITAVQAKRLSALVYRKTYVTLRKLALALGSDYDPLANYDMLETMAGSDSKSGKDTTTHKATEYGQKTTETATGFDSSGDGATTGTTDTSVTQGAKPGEDEITYASGTSHGHTMTRKGNIGVTTSQQMAESELALRALPDYWDRVLEAAVKEICIPY